MSTVFVSLPSSKSSSEGNRSAILSLGRVFLEAFEEVAGIEYDLVVLVVCIGCLVRWPVF